MSGLEFEHKGQTYRAGRLDAKKQFHVSRRLAPFLADIMSGLDPKDMLAKAEQPEALGAQAKEGETEGLAWLAPLASTLADMPDERLDYILNACLSVTERKQATGGWAKVQVAGTLMFEDIDMAGMIALAFNVLKHNLSGFFDALPQGLPGMVRT